MGRLGIGRGIDRRLKMERTFWLGGVYEKLGAYSSKEDAERGMSPDETLDDMLEDFKGKKVKIQIEVVED